MTYDIGRFEMQRDEQGTMHWAAALRYESNDPLSPGMKDTDSMPPERLAPLGVTLETILPGVTANIIGEIAALREKAAKLEAEAANYTDQSQLLSSAEQSLTDERAAHQATQAVLSDVQAELAALRAQPAPVAED